MKQCIDSAIEDEVIYGEDPKSLASLEEADKVFKENTWILEEPHNVSYVVAIVSEWGEPVVILLDDHINVVHRYEHDTSDI